MIAEEKIAVLPVHKAYKIFSDKKLLGQYLWQKY